MTIEDLKILKTYSFSCNVNVEQIKKDIDDTDVYDEWGFAELFINDKQGVEYNLCIDQSYTEKWIEEIEGKWILEERIKNGEQIDKCPTNSSAIYLFEYNEETDCLETDYDSCIHYEIDFNDVNWKEKLENAMCAASIELFRL